MTHTQEQSPGLAAGKNGERAAGNGIPSPGDPPTSYIEGIRTAELVPVRKIPPRHGWRLAMYRATFGLINPGRSRDERRLAELEATIRTGLRGKYKIGVLGKGGVGKTTITACVGSVFAELRNEDRIVAIDADTAFGRLAGRIDPTAAGSFWELIADQHLDNFADIKSRLGSNAAGLYVLPGESVAVGRHIIDPGVYREAVNRLDKHFTIFLIDCGSTMDHTVTIEALRDLSALIVVSSAWVDGASSAALTMEWLASAGHNDLLNNTIVVLNDLDGRANRHTVATLREQFTSMGPTVIELPYDPQLRPGGPVDMVNEVGEHTRRRILEIAARLAGSFAATTDKHRRA
jgi:MinD-like ATPase involved in chromosome partitioning or flagellar assembly